MSEMVPQASLPKTKMPPPGVSPISNDAAVDRLASMDISARKNAALSHGILIYFSQQFWSND